MPGAYQRSLFMAAIFPEVAALAAVLATPPGADHLLSAAQHALGYAETPHRHDIRDALSIWVTAREAGRFLQPASAYAHAGHHHDGTPRITEGRLTAERQTATRLRRDRRAPLIPSPGPPMPYACRSVTPSSRDTDREYGRGGPTSARSDSIVSVRLSGTVVVTP